MLTRIYVDNFRCFVNFEFKPRQRELILGANGAGKSTLIEALLLLRQWAVNGDPVDGSPIQAYRTRWTQQARIAFELEADLDGVFQYRLVLEPWGDQHRTRIAEETLRFDRKPILAFSNGIVQTYNAAFEPDVAYDFEPRRSALAMTGGRQRELARFRTWLADLHCFRINPFNMSMLATGEQQGPVVDLSNFAAWYRHLLQTQPRSNAALIDSLEQAIDGFQLLSFESVNVNDKVLAAEIGISGGKPIKYFLNELSEGQRCLIALYSILHFVIAKGRTVIIDEPDNFISLREIQPWLMALDDAMADQGGQVMLISHHPEIVNQWAPSAGTQFVRDGAGPVRVRGFDDHGDPVLAPAELIARGWDNA